MLRRVSTIIGVTVVVLGTVLVMGVAHHGASGCVEKFYDRYGDWWCNIGHYHWGDYLAVELDGPGYADFDLEVWRENSRYCSYGRCTINVSRVAGSYGWYADEYTDLCVWNTANYWVKVIFVRGSGNFWVRWNWTVGGCR